MTWKKLKQHLKSRWFEFDQGFLMFVWGLSLTHPYNTFATFPTVYRGLAQFAPEIAWGAVAISLGLFRMVSVALKLRTELGPFSGAWFWATVCAAMSMSGWFWTGPPSYACLALISLHTFVVLKIEHNTHRQNIDRRQSVTSSPTPASL